MYLKNQSNIHNNKPMLKVQNLKTYFPIYGGLLSTIKGYVHAVDDVSFEVYAGETFGLVGESGCGKSTLAQTIMSIVPPTFGTIEFCEKNTQTMTKKELRRSRRDLQIIFQDPYSSLDPRMSVGQIVEEPLLVHGEKDGGRRKEKALEILETVGLEPSYYNRYPHEFSGGQRQRISIARSLILKPKLILCDEPVSALDVSIQSQILNLLRELQVKMNLTYIFISHALNVVRHVSDRVCIMYLGKIMELAPSETIFTNSCHPYTKALLSAIPIPDPTVQRERILLGGELPSPRNPPSGCGFSTRCPQVQPVCRKEEPILKLAEAGHYAACHFA